MNIDLFKEQLESANVWREGDQRRCYYMVEYPNSYSESGETSSNPTYSLEMHRIWERDIPSLSEKYDLSPNHEPGQKYPRFRAK